MSKRVRVEAPADLEPLEIAQAIVGSHLLLKAEHRPSWETRPFIVWEPLQGLYEMVLTFYRSHLNDMLARVNVVLGVDVLEKAVKPLLTPAQVREVAKLIRDYHTALVLSLGMDDHVDPEEVRRLVKGGILPPKAADIVEDAYLFGQLVASVRELGEKADLKKMTYQEFKAAIKARPVGLTTEQKRAIDWAKHSAATHIKGLGNRVSDDWSKVAVEADADLRREYEGVIRDTLESNIERQQTVRKLASDLGHATEDWSRDLGRIAATEKQQAFQEGFASKLIQSEGDSSGIYVAKIPKPDACPDCVRLHLMEGLGSRPRIFKLSELQQNGTNRGVKRANWRAVVGTVHPWCACELIHVPNGWRFEHKPGKDVKATKVKGKDAWMLDSSKPWRPRLVPDSFRRSDVFTRDLLKSFLTYKNVPTEGVSIQIGDTEILREVEAVVRQTPQELFHKDVGVTLITWDHPRPQVALNEHDLAYWTGNEIRLSHALTPDKVGAVLRHELGHALNVYLVRKWGGETAVREWHAQLFQIAKEEGFVSQYASTLPIECAAEATRLYLYERKKLMLRYPRQFAALHAAYRDVWRHRDSDDETVRAGDGLVEGAGPEPDWAQGIVGKPIH